MPCLMILMVSSIRLMRWNYSSVWVSSHVRHVGLSHINFPLRKRLARRRAADRTARGYRGGPSVVCASVVCAVVCFGGLNDDCFGWLNRISGPIVATFFSELSPALDVGFGCCLDIVALPSAFCVVGSPAVLPCWRSAGCAGRPQSAHSKCKYYRSDSASFHCLCPLALVPPHSATRNNESLTRGVNK